MRKKYTFNGVTTTLGFLHSLMVPVPIWFFLACFLEQFLQHGSLRHVYWQLFPGLKTIQFWKVFSLIWQPSPPPRHVKDIVPLSSCFHSLFLTTKLFTYLSLLLSVHKAFLPLALWVPPPLLLALSNSIMMHVMDISPNVLWFGFTKSLQFVVLWFSSCWENFCHYFDSILMYGLCNRNASSLPGSIPWTWGRLRSKAVFRVKTMPCETLEHNGHKMTGLFFLFVCFNFFSLVFCFEFCWDYGNWHWWSIWRDLESPGKQASGLPVRDYLD